MKRGFTLLELIVVLIIVGILATLGFTQYIRMVEKMRGAEARAILGDLRKKAAAYRLERGALGAPAVMIPALDITVALGDTPLNCTQVSHYFSYNVTASADPSITLTATRCATGLGKSPGSPLPALGGAGGQTLTLISNLSTGVDTWGGTGPWD